MDNNTIGFIVVICLPALAFIAFVGVRVRRAKKTEPPQGDGMFYTFNVEDTSTFAPGNVARFDYVGSGWARLLRIVRVTDGVLWCVTLPWYQWLWWRFKIWRQERAAK